MGPETRAIRTAPAGLAPPAATLVGRVGTPGDVTHVVRALLAAEAGWTTGQVVSPNGGTVLVH